ncbi:MAG: Flp pilus assembly complex ATPase component [Nitrospirae bacterium]|nr:Flp pilus assembly complex ATPase component [Nitrospirota bacterium]
MAILKSPKKRLNDILVEGKLLTKEELGQALAIQRQEGHRLSHILVEKGYVREDDLIACLGKELGIPPINLTRYQVDPKVVNIVPESMARYYHLFPVSCLGRFLTAAMADPLNVFAIDDIKMITGYKIEPVISTERDIKDALDRYYGSKTSMDKIFEEVEDPDLQVMRREKEAGFLELLTETEEVPVIKVVNLILMEALKRRASDIHVEPYRNSLRVRCRVDGVLQEIVSPPKQMQGAIIARLKIMAGLDIAEHRVPQDGRFKVRLQGKEIDYRVSLLPIGFGEKIVLRALDKDNLNIGLDKLGFEPDTTRKFQESMARPYGMILVTGPTGSGKSTTLYSVLNQLNTPDRNIITIEDPVEYQVEGLTQVQVKPEIGLTFANGLRSLLRQSPDVIMIGEIRDKETADIAIKAALTGQIIFSTLHTNDAPGAMTRLMDMGMEPFLISSSIIMVAAQRLVRKICPRCKEVHEVPAEVRERMGLKNSLIFRGKGCRNCSKTGYFGRVAILEVLEMNEEISNLVIEGASADRIKEAARKAGMKTLQENGIEKIKSGITSLEEVLRVTSD